MGVSLTLNADNREDMRATCAHLESGRTGLGHRHVLTAPLEDLPARMEQAYVCRV